MGIKDFIKKVVDPVPKTNKEVELEIKMLKEQNQKEEDYLKQQKELNELQKQRDLLKKEKHAIKKDKFKRSYTGRLLDNIADQTGKDGKDDDKPKKKFYIGGQSL